MECPWAIIKSNKNNFRTSAVAIAKKTAFVPFIPSVYVIKTAYTTALIKTLVFVDKPNMAALLEKQRVLSRHRKSNSSMLTNKSAGFNSGFMSQFNQKPVRSRKKSPQIKKTGWNFEFPSFKKNAKTRQKPPPYREIREQPRRSGFSFPIPPLSSLAVIAGTVVISLAVLNWELLDIRIPSEYIINPAADSDVENHTRLYAATGITGIIPAQGNISGSSAELEGNAASAGSFSASALAEKPDGQTPVSEAPQLQEDGSIIIFKWHQYRVQRGDSISVIAQRFGVSVGAIIASNDIRNARTLQEGATLRIPNIDGIPYQIRNGDNLSRIAATFKVPLEVILDVNDIKSDVIKTGETIFIPGARMNDIDLRLVLGELFIYPVASRFVTSHYGMRRDPISGEMSFHTGIDLRADIGTTVMAALDGVISVTGENWLHGKHIIMSHDNGYKTLYAHLNSFSVKQGDRVARGRKIGEAGNTGYSTGPHLHFGIYDKNSKLVNPLELIR